MRLTFEQGVSRYLGSSEQGSLSKIHKRPQLQQYCVLILLSMKMAIAWGRPNRKSMKKKGSHRSTFGTCPAGAGCHQRDQCEHFCGATARRAGTAGPELVPSPHENPEVLGNAKGPLEGVPI